MNEEKETKPGSKKKKKRLKTVLIAGISVIVLIAAVVGVQIYINLTSDEEPEIYEGSVTDILNEVAEAQEKYYESGEKYGTLEELATGKLLENSGIASGKFAGYIYELHLSDDGQDWGLKAWPQKPGQETKSYFIDSTGEIRFLKYASAGDEKAGPDSSLLWEEGDWGADD